MSFSRRYSRQTISIPIKSPVNRPTIALSVLKIIKEALIADTVFINCLYLYSSRKDPIKLNKNTTAIPHSIGRI